MPEIKFKSEDGRTLSYQTQGAAPTDVEIWEMYKLSRPPAKVAEIEDQYMSRLSPGQARTFTISGVVPDRDIQVPFSRPHTMPTGGPGVGMPLEEAAQVERERGLIPGEFLLPSSMVSDPHPMHVAREQPGEMLTYQQIEARQTADPRTMTSWIEPPTSGFRGQGAASVGVSLPAAGDAGYLGEIISTAPGTAGFMTGVAPGAVAGVASPLYGKGREDISQKLEHAEQRLASQVREGQGFLNAWGKNITDDAGEFIEAMEQMAPAMERWYADQARRPAGEGFVEGVERGFEFGMAMPEQVYADFTALVSNPVDYLTTHPVGTVAMVAPAAKMLMSAGYLAGSPIIRKLIQKADARTAAADADAVDLAMQEAMTATPDPVAAAAIAPLPELPTHQALPGRLALPGRREGSYPSPEVPPLPPSKMSPEYPALMGPPDETWIGLGDAGSGVQFIAAHPPQGGRIGKIDNWILRQQQEALGRPSAAPWRPDIDLSAPRAAVDEAFIRQGVQGEQAAALSAQVMDATPAQLAEHFGTRIEAVRRHLPLVRQKYAEDLAERASKAGSVQAIPLSARDYTQLTESIQAKAKVYPPGMQRPAVTPPEPAAPPKPPPVVPRAARPRVEPKPDPGEGRFGSPGASPERPWTETAPAAGVVDDVLEAPIAARSARRVDAAIAEAQAVGAGVAVDLASMGKRVIEPGKHAVTRPKRLEYGLDVEIYGPENTSQWIRKAQEDGFADPIGTASRSVAESVLINPRPLSKVEEVGLAIRRGMLEKSYDHGVKKLHEAIDMAASPERIKFLQSTVDKTLQEFDALTRASELGGSEWGRAGVARQREIRFDYSKAGLVRKAKEAKKSTLTPEEQAVFHQASEKMDPIYKELKELLAERAEKAQALEAINEGAKKGSPEAIKKLESSIDELDNKIAASQVALSKLETRLGIELTKLLPPGEKAVKLAFGIAEALKTLAASIDLSAPGRQAAHVTFNPLRYKTTKKSFVDSLRMWKDPQFYQKTIDDLKNTKQGRALSDRGMVFTDITNREAINLLRDPYAINKAEEAIRSPIGEVMEAINPSDIADLIESLGPKVRLPPGLAKSAKAQESSKKLAGFLNGWGRLITGSNRAYTGYLNSVRFTLGKELLKLDRKGESPLPMDDQLFLVDAINKMTGRGTLFGAETTRTGRAALNTANLVLFAPQLKLGQLQAPVKFLDVGGKFGKGGATARAVAAREVAAPMAARLALMQFAQLAGADVGWSIDDGTRWGKIGYQVGSWNVAVDLWGGANSPYRQALESVLLGGRYTRRGQFIEYGQGASAAQAAIGGAAVMWASPAASAIYRLLFMEDVFGYAPESKALHTIETIGGLATTISGANAFEMMVHGALEEGLPGFAAGAALGAVEFFGGTTSADFTRSPFRRVLEGVNLLSKPEPVPELLKELPEEFPSPERTY